MRPPRPLTTDDLGRVIEIERTTFSDPWSHRAFVESLRNETVRSTAIDDLEGRLIGYGLASLVVDEGEILNLAVDPAVRRRGIGRALLEGLLDQLREGGARQAWLEVRPSNQAAIGLYRSAGFRPQGLRRAYYLSPGEDALTMALELASQTARK